MFSTVLRGQKFIFICLHSSGGRTSQSMVRAKSDHPLSILGCSFISLLRFQKDVISNLIHLEHLDMLLHHELPILTHKEVRRIIPLLMKKENHLYNHFNILKTNILLNVQIKIYYIL